MVLAPAKLTPGDIYDEYQKGVSYNYSIDLYDQVRKNENFFIGNQWDGVDAPDLDKPVFNVIKRVCNMFISQIVSDDITASSSTFTNKAVSEDAMAVIGRELERAIEYSHAKQKNREVLRNACVDGDGCVYVYFDADAKTGQMAQGLIGLEVIDVYKRQRKRCAVSHTRSFCSMRLRRRIRKFSIFCCKSWMMGA